MLRKILIILPVILIIAGDVKADYVKDASERVKSADWSKM